MQRLIYTSLATRPISHTDTNRISVIARERNLYERVTSCLAHDGTKYLQVLEGEARTVAAIHQSIAADPRHESIRVLESRSVKNRLFNGASLICVDVRRVAFRPYPSASPQPQFNWTTWGAEQSLSFLLWLSRTVRPEVEAPVPVTQKRARPWIRNIDCGVWTAATAA